MIIGRGCCLGRIRAAVLLFSDCKRVNFLNCFAYIVFGVIFLGGGALSGCISSDRSSEIRFIHDRANAAASELLEIDRSVFRGAAAEDVMIVLEIGSRDGGNIVLLDTPPKWRIVEPAENDSSRLGTVRICLEESRNYDVVAVSVFVKGELASKKFLNIRR